METPHKHCHWCAVITSVGTAKPPHPWTGTRDHVHPRRGGERAGGCTVHACYRCNQTRRNRTVAQWRAWLDTDDGARFIAASHWLSQRAGRARKVRLSGCTECGGVALPPG